MPVIKVNRNGVGHIVYQNFISYVVNCCLATLSTRFNIQLDAAAVNNMLHFLSFGLLLYR